MKKKNISIINLSVVLLIVVFLVWRCEDLKQNKQEITIKGSINNFEKFDEFISVRIFVNDYTGNQRQTYDAFLDQNGRFKLKFHKVYPQDIQFKYGNTWLRLFVSPGNNLVVNFDAEKITDPNLLQEAIEFKGKEAQMNKEILNYRINCLNKHSVWNEYHLKIKDLSPLEYKNFLYKLLEEDLKILNDYISFNKPGEKFRVWAKYQLDYACAWHLMRYRWYHPVMNKINEEEFIIPEKYFDFFDKFKIDNEPATVSYFYRNYLKEYKNFLEEKIRDIIVRKFESGDKLVAQKFRIDNLISNLDGFALDAILTQHFDMLIEAKKIEVLEENFEIYLNIIQNSSFKDRIITKYNNLKTLIKNPEISKNRN